MEIIYIISNNANPFCTVFLAFLNLKDVINFMLICGRFWELKIKVCFACVYVLCCIY